MKVLTAPTQNEWKNEKCRTFGLKSTCAFHPTELRAQTQNAEKRVKIGSDF